jgi:hypothetical protein
LPAGLFAEPEVVGHIYQSISTLTQYDNAIKWIDAQSFESKVVIVPSLRETNQRIVGHQDEDIIIMTDQSDKTINFLSLWTGG